MEKAWRVEVEILRHHTSYQARLYWCCKCRLSYLHSKVFRNISKSLLFYFFCDEMLEFATLKGHFKVIKVWLFLDGFDSI